MLWELWIAVPWFFVVGSFLVTLFWVAASKPERIHRPRQFRIACFIFATTLCSPVPAFITAVDRNWKKFPLSGSDPLVSISINVVGPVLLMVSFLLAIEAIAPRPGKNKPPVSVNDSGGGA